MHMQVILDSLFALGLGPNIYGAGRKESSGTGLASHGAVGLSWHQVLDSCLRASSYEPSNRAGSLTVTNSVVCS